MNLKIDTLNIEFPASLGGRKHSILRLLRSELVRLDWPQGQLKTLTLPAITLSSQQTNLSIARVLALSLHKATQPLAMTHKQGQQPASRTLPSLVRSTLPSLVRSTLPKSNNQGGTL